MQLDQYHLSYLTQRVGKSASEASAMLESFKTSELGKQFDWSSDHTEHDNKIHSLITVAMLKMAEQAATPTPNQSNEGVAEHIPLIMALQGFRIRSYSSLLGEPSQFCRKLSLVCGEQELPAVDDATVASRLSGQSFSEAPSDPRELGLAAARLSQQGWPEAAIYAVRGIMAFGPCNFNFAEKCALYSLTLERECLLAKQILNMLRVQQEYQRSATKLTPAEKLALFEKAAIDPAYR